MEGHKFLKHASFILVFAFFGFISSKIFFPITPGSANVDSTASATLELDVEPTLEMALSTASLDLSAGGETEILPTSEGITATGTVDVYVTTNALSGYELKMYTPDHADMKHINDAVSTSIAATSGGSTLTNNTWGYQSSYAPGAWVAVGVGANNAKPLTNGSSSSNSALCDLTDIAHCTNGTYDTATITFGAKLTDTLPAGRYTSDVVFTAIAKVPYVKTLYTINYEANGGTGSASSTTVSSPNGTAILSTGSTMTPPTGKGLIGWSTSSDTDPNDTEEYFDLTATPTLEDLIISAESANPEQQPSTTNPNITLYAVWADQMQAFSCSSLTTIGDSTRLVDIRDNKPYTVEKLADNKCWMMNNLAIENKRLTSTDTNLADNAVFDLTTGVVYNTSSGWCEDDSAECYDVKAAYVNNTGGFYNWYTATAGNGVYDTNGASVTVAYDICPKNWRLPVGGNNTATNEFSILDIALNPQDSLAGTDRNDTTSGINIAALNTSFNNLKNIFPLYGRIRGYLYFVDYAGNYWSSTSSSNMAGAYSFYITDALHIEPWNNYFKYYGRSVRCLAKN